MTYNVFGGTLNPAQSNQIVDPYNWSECPEPVKFSSVKVRSRHTKGPLTPRADMHLSACIRSANGSLVECGCPLTWTGLDIPQQQQQPFYGSLDFVWDNRVSRYQKKHWPTHTHRGHQLSISAFSIYHDPWHPLYWTGLDRVRTFTANIRIHAVWFSSAQMRWDEISCFIGRSVYWFPFSVILCFTFLVKFSKCLHVVVVTSLPAVCLTDRLPTRKSSKCVPIKVHTFGLLQLRHAWTDIDDFRQRRKINCLLIAYLVSNISAKNYQTHLCVSYRKPVVWLFLDIVLSCKDQEVNCHAPIIRSE